MGIAIIQITQEELAARAINTNSEKLTFENQVFTKGPSFSLRCKEPALKYCQQLAKKKLKTLLIEGQYGFTIWTQFHQTNKQNLARQEYNSKTSSTTKSNQQSGSSRKVIGRYRGQVNEASPNNGQDAGTENLLHKMLPRKYRGQYIN